MSMVFLFSVLFSTFVYALTPQEMVAKADKFRGFEKQNVFTVEVVDFKDSKDISRSKFKVYSKDWQTTLVNTLSPPRQANRRLLMLEDNLWFYSPDNKRATRVALQDRLTGEVSKGDLARTNFAADYKAEMLGEEKYQGRDVVKLLLRAKSKGATYQAIRYYLEKNNQMPLRAEFLTSSGKVLKLAEFSKPKVISGRTIVTEIKIVDGINRKKSSIMNYSNYVFEKLDDAIFNKNSMGDSF